MRTRLPLLVGTVLFVAPAFAENGHDHGGVFHAFRLETDAGVSGGEAVATWDLDGWIGGDFDKLWIKSEGEIRDGGVEEAGVWALYSRNVATFWDAQIGLRRDFEPDGHSWLAAGVTGLAPYFFEAEAHLFVREDGNVSARLRFERDLLFTNRLIVQPYGEANLGLQKDVVEGNGAGLVDAALGIQTRYEITRGFAPYFDLSFARKFGRTAEIARSRDENVDEAAVKIGVRWIF